jgi:hypothetical protein
MLNKILFSFIWFSSLLITHWVSASYVEDMLPWNKEGVTNSLLKDAPKWETQVDEVSSWVISSLETLLPITAVGVFLFVGIKLAMARWNPEEFKKAWMQFMYAIIGIFIMSFAWVTVKIVLGLSF